MNKTLKRWACRLTVLRSLVPVRLQGCYPPTLSPLKPWRNGLQAAVILACAVLWMAPEEHEVFAAMHNV